MTERFSKFIAYHPKLILTVALLLLIPCFFGISATRINYDILSYLPDEHDSVKGEAILDEVFGNAASAFLIVSDMPSKDVLRVKNEINNIDGVKNVIWTDSFADISIPQSILPDILKNIFYSSDGKSTLMMIQFSSSAADSDTMKAVEKIKTVMNKQCFLSGMSVLLSDTKNIVEAEAPFYVFTAALFAIAALFFTMSSLVMPFVLMLSLAFAVVYNMGTNVFGEISYITQSLAVILQIGVTMDYSIFLMDRYEEELKKSKEKKAAMSHAIRKTVFSIASSSLTTVFGFIALCFMSFTLGFDIGFVMSKGVILGVITAVTVLPSLLLIFHKPIHKLSHKPLTPSFTAVSTFAVRHKKGVVAVFTVLIALAYVLKSNVGVYYDFVKALPQDMTSVVSLNKLKSDFNMVTTHFVITDENLLPYESAEMAGKFKNTDGVTSVLSLETLSGPAIPENMIPESILSVCRKGGYELMMVSSAYPSSSDESNRQISELDRILKSYDKNGFITGEGALSRDLVMVTDRDFRVTSVISIVAVFLVIAVFFKSLAIPIILVSSIEFAIFVNEAIPFFFGEEISFIAPTVIGCVELGATVDYAILLTTRFKEELMHGKASFRAIRDAVSSSNRSIFQSSLIFFCATFGVYCVCNITLVKGLCLMLARGAVISALVIMFFLPALLSLAEPIIFKRVN